MASGNLKRFIDSVATFLNSDLTFSRSTPQATTRDGGRYPLLCPLGLLLLILAHVFLACGEVVLAATHHDVAYMVLFSGDFLLLCLLCAKAYQRWRRVLKSRARDCEKKRRVIAAPAGVRRDHVGEQHVTKRSTSGSPHVKAE